MNDTLKEWVIAIGVFLGLVAPQVDPQLNIKIFKTEAALYFSLEIENCINNDMEELILAANTLVVRVEILADKDKEIIKELAHSIRYNPLDGYYTIYYGETEKTHRTNNQAAAYAIFASFYQVALLPAAEFEALKQKSFYFQASIHMEENGDFDPAVLWNYKQPEQKFNYKTLKEIPY